MTPHDCRPANLIAGCLLVAKISKVSGFIPCSRKGNAFCAGTVDHLRHRGMAVTGKYRPHSAFCEIIHRIAARPTAATADIRSLL
jgi:hypothetical protein